MSAKSSSDHGLQALMVGSPSGGLGRIRNMPRLALLGIRVRVSLFDHVVGAREQRRGHFEAKSPRGLEIDRQFVLGRLLYRKIRGLAAFEYLIHVASNDTGTLFEARAV
jgi:hypothetical protein